MFAQSQATCNECGGRGKIIAKKCPHCSGNKVCSDIILAVLCVDFVPQVVDHTGHYTLEILPGMPEGHEIVFEGESDESPDWEAGDVVLRVRSRKHKGGWRRKESSLYWRETIGVDEVCRLSTFGFKTDLFSMTGFIRFRPQCDPSRWAPGETSKEGRYSTRYVAKNISRIAIF